MSELRDAASGLSMGESIGNSEGLVTILLAATTTLIHRVKYNATADITKIVVTNRGAALTMLNLGTTVDGTTATAFTQRYPSIPVIVNGMQTYIEAEIAKLFEHFNATTNILAQISVATTVDLKIEVRETV